MPFTTLGILTEPSLLSGTEAVIYTVGTDLMGASINVRLAAVDAVAYGVTLLVRRAGSSTSWRITGFSYALTAGGDAVYPPDGSLKLGPGDQLRAYAATANKVVITVEGATAPLSSV